MTLNEFLEYMNRGEAVTGGSEAHLFMLDAAQEALQITAELNIANQLYISPRRSIEGNIKLDERPTAFHCLQ